MNRLIDILIDKKFLDSLYGFSYSRTNNSYDAEDLCADIVISVLKASQRNSDVINHHAFIWTIARRVYADFCQKRKIMGDTQSHAVYCDEHTTNTYNPIEEYVENEDDKLQLKKIMHEICFLSRIYREVCIMYYLDEMKVSDIAKRLDISQNTVKQRLYSARETIKKGVNKKMDTTNLTLKPVNFYFMGNGKPVGNSPIENAQRSFSKNLVYLCKDTERTVKELSELLNVPMPFVEEEINIQLRGQNGRYGLLRKTENDKYISNVAIIDYKDYITANELLGKHSTFIAAQLNTFISQNKQKLLSMPFLNKQNDISLIAWPLMKHIGLQVHNKIANALKEKHLSGVTKLKREYTVCCIAYPDGKVINVDTYGWDGIYAQNICGYSSVHVSNMYGRHLRAHFHCAHNLSTDLALQYAAKSIGGLKVSDVPESEREAVAVAIEAGYIKKENDMLYPLILVSEKENIFSDIANEFANDLNKLIEPLVEDIYQFIKKFLPKHLLGEYEYFAILILQGLDSVMIEKCIEANIITPPTKPRSPEGVLMTVKK